MRVKFIWDIKGGIEMKILLMEDDYNYNESIKEYLESLGYEVDAFFDGESALDAIMQKPYYLLLLDVKVPKLNGHELIRYVKEAHITTPIIIITSLTDINSIAIGYELGCNDYLKKPFELKELELRVKELIKNITKPITKVMFYWRGLVFNLTLESFAGEMKRFF